VFFFFLCFFYFFLLVFWCIFRRAGLFSLPSFWSRPFPWSVSSFGRGCAFLSALGRVIRPLILRHSRAIMYNTLKIISLNAFPCSVSCPSPLGGFSPVHDALRERRCQPVHPRGFSADTFGSLDFAGPIKKEKMGPTSKTPHHSEGNASEGKRGGFLCGRVESSIPYPRLGSLQLPNHD